MTTDIVERLRAHPGPDDTVTVQFRTMVKQRHEAADYIERLWATLSDMCEHFKQYEDAECCKRVYAQARRALEQKP